MCPILMNCWCPQTTVLVLRVFKNNKIVMTHDLGCNLNEPGRYAKLPSLESSPSSEISVFINSTLAN